jgi:hypothetical protein
VRARRNKIPKSTPSSNQFSSRLIVSNLIFALGDWCSGPSLSGLERTRHSPEDTSAMWILIKYPSIR